MRDTFKRRKNIKQNVRNCYNFKGIIKGVTKCIMVFVLLLLISVVLSFIFPDKIKEISDIFAMLFVIYLLTIYFRLLPGFSNCREIKNLENKIEKNTYENSKLTLYEWITNDHGHILAIYEWLRIDQDKCLIKNLTNIKNNIMLNVGDNVNDYHLLRKYLDYQRNNNLLNNLWKKILYAIIPLVLSGLFINVDIFNWVNNNLFSVNNNADVFGTFEIIIRISAIVLFLLFSFLYIFGEFTKEKRRLDLLTEIIDLIILEKEILCCQC